MTFLQGLIINLLLAGYGYSSKITYSNCNNGALLGTATDVRIIGCQSDPCELLAGSKVTLEIDFTLRKLLFDLFIHFFGKSCIIKLRNLFFLLTKNFIYYFTMI